MENSTKVSQKLKIKLPYDPEIPFRGIYIKEMKLVSWQISVLPYLFQYYNSQDMETTYMFIDRRMDKKDGI